MNAALSPTLTFLLDEARRRFGARADRVRPDEDLFDALDIDSIVALELLSAVEDHFDVEIPDYELRSARTFAELAALVDRRR